MPTFLVDEDLPRSTARILRAEGYAAADVREVGLRGQSDAAVFAYAQATGATLISADKGFTNILTFPLGAHAGIIILRLPNELPTQQLNLRLVRAIRELGDEALAGRLVIVEPARTRIRRPSAPQI